MRGGFRTYFLAAAVAVSIQARGAFSESPDLRRQVEAGKLPPLDNRLPTAPLVVTPLEKPGKYGGTWRMVVAGYDDAAALSRSLAYEHLVRWDPNWSRVAPNLASGWTVNTNSTVYRFQLRPGMHWSDGHPFTARDIVAWMDDVARDPEVTTVPPGWLVVGGQLPQCTAPDDFTVEFQFPARNALFLEQLAGMRANELTRYPSHYFRKLHRRHNPEGAAELMRRTGLPWAEAFKTAYTPWTWRNVGVPTLDAWILATAYAPGTPTVVAVRNPYYWKVDTLGRQLPYLDEVRVDVVADNSELLKRAVAGQIDYQRENFNNVASTTALREAERAGRIRTVGLIPSAPNPIAICLNLVHRDLVMRKVLSDRNVRIALSEAIDRQTIIQQLFGGEGRPWQIAPRPESPYHNRHLGEQYTEFKPKISTRRLEEAGLHASEPGGVRKLPDGRSFHLKIAVPGPDILVVRMILEGVKRDWLAVGVAMDWETLPREEFYSVVDQNRHDGAIWSSGGGYAATLEPEYFVPVTFERLGALRVFYAVPWARWFIDPLA